MPNELTNTNVVETIDSREVAEMIDVRHDNLLKKISNYQYILDSSKLRSQDFFIKSTYINVQNKEQPCYLLTKKGCEMVANKLTGEKGILFTAQYVNRFQEMEQAVKQPVTPALPNDYVEALEHLLNQVRMNQQLVLENNQLRFKLEMKEVEENRLWTIDEIAKEHGMSAIALNQFLAERRIQYTRKGRWFLFKKYRNKGYTKVKSNWLKWTNEGKLFIEKVLAS